MSLRCSLTGHDWGEKRVETHREEKNGQVAVTEREYQTCDRCGKRRLISENTEVRAIDDGEDDDENTSTFAPSEEFETTETDDAAILDSDNDGDSAADTPDASWSDDDAETDDEVRDAVREATGTEVTTTATSDETADYVCPDCGFASSDDSLRGGDICPECGGYLEET